MSAKSAGDVTVEGDAKDEDGNGENPRRGDRSREVFLSSTRVVATAAGAAATTGTTLAAWSASMHMRSEQLPFLFFFLLLRLAAGVAAAEAGASAKETAARPRASVPILWFAARSPRDAHLKHLSPWSEALQ